MGEAARKDEKSMKIQLLNRLELKNVGVSERNFLRKFISKLEVEIFAFKLT